ncbi:MULTISPECIES: SigE family RNA polymerase sigma factor [Streptomyces albovinaceus subgroup]|uniref:SigE family RNA polymerase sigma factor n=1 Tax=Streptomyces albovinaceus subgroup TaxID=1482558 RepID=UPI00099C6E5B|nr:MULTISPECIES: SigE family RNA polymerase sigma factor [Streptomyces albovinaceus subgroup]WSF76879.1 SigE family RNA polymerase sigma factor [Streptomyces globisporus]WSU81324.1 SigE family RNA polymerase sigma factor [Streptomyces globisporus]
MNALHSTSSSAVVTRLHDIGRGSEKSGVTGGTSLLERSREPGGVRGCVRSAGRQHLPSQSTAEQPRSTYMTVVDAPTGDVGGNGGSAYGKATGDRTTGAENADAEAAFTAYVQERRASLYATAYHLTGDRFEAEDLLQSALFSTYRAWDRISDKAAVGGYLRRTMTNLHISAWRRRKLNEYPTEELPETVGDTDAMRGTELRAVLWQALARLPELQRTMLVLRYYEGRTDPEIASILDISVGTVKSSIWRSLRRLREDEVLSFGRDEQESFGELVA